MAEDLSSRGGGGDKDLRLMKKVLSDYTVDDLSRGNGDALTLHNVCECDNPGGFPKYCGKKKKRFPPL